MISFLIPVYNCDVTDLVDKLHKQCSRINQPFEILVFDDRSSDRYRKVNAPLASYFGVNYTELSKNLGRARIRNWLAKSASYEHLVFLDCDSGIKERKFVRNYLSFTGQEGVIAGGRDYKPSPPRAKTKKLHWLYGSKRESRSVRFRNRHPYIFFHSNNFMIRKSLILDLRFDESITGYGYEDLMFAQRLKERGISIRHVDNPVRHQGLEKNSVFLKKTRSAIDNLLHLKYSGQAIPTRMQKLADRLLDLGLAGDFMWFYRRIEQRVEKNLLSAHPSLRALDMYKLYYYLSERAERVR